MEDNMTRWENQDPKWKIIIKEGTEYQSLVENVYCPNTFFHSSYIQAVGCVEDILRVAQTDPWEKIDRLRDRSSDLKLSDKLLGYPNNVIAFCAERGQGKTSAMVSFAQALSKLNRRENQEQWVRIYGSTALAPEYQFEVFNSIDPSSLNNQQSILDIILTRISSRFEEYWEQQFNQCCSIRVQDDALNQRRYILQSLQKCFCSLQAPNKEYLIDDDALERIMELGESGNIRGSLYRLICSYLNFTQHTEKSYLVLQIDDADLSLGDTFQLIDQIRRNLVMPRVIILLAANMFQLESTVEQHFIKQYQQSIQLHGMVSTETCHNIAARYLDKVIPSTRQIYLPDLGKLFAREYKNIQMRYISRENSQINFLTDGGLRYQEQLLRYIYERTGLVLLDPQNHLHNLLPGNMRELAQFLPYFQGLPQLKIGYRDLINAYIDPTTLNHKDVDIWLNNLDRLKEYLINNWAPTNLRAEGHQFLKELYRYEDANLHRYVLDFLPDYYASERLRSIAFLGITSSHKEDNRQQFIEQCRARGLRYYTGPDGWQHASYVDVMEALNILSRLPDAQRHYKFIYAVRLYYTIWMHHLLLERFQGTSWQSRGLLDFLCDIMWRRDDIQTTLVGIRYGHYTLDAKELLSCLGRLTSQGSINQQCLGSIKAFCRREVLRHGFYSATPIQSQDLLEDSPKQYLSFHFFYPLLLDLELLTEEEKRPSVTKADVKNNPVLQDRILGSMILLLNWDMQYILSRGYMGESEITDSGSEPVLLPLLFRSIFGNNKAMEKAFELVKQATGKPWNADLFRYYFKTDKADVDKNMALEGNERMDPTVLTLYAIQFCIPELKQHLVSYCKNAVRRLEKNLAVLKNKKFGQNISIRNLYLLKSEHDPKDPNVEAINALYSTAVNADTPLWAFVQMQSPNPNKISCNEPLVNLSPAELKKYVNNVTLLLDEVIPEPVKEVSAIQPQEPPLCRNCQANIDHLVGQLQELFSNVAVVKLEPVNPTNSSSNN